MLENINIINNIHGMDVLENNFYTCNFLDGGGSKLWQKFMEEMIYLRGIKTGPQILTGFIGMNQILTLQIIKQPPLTEGYQYTLPKTGILRNNYFDLS